MFNENQEKKEIMQDITSILEARNNEILNK
jgi:hypothetical protein